MENGSSISIFVERPIYPGADHVYDASSRIILKHVNVIDDNCEASGIAQVVRRKNCPPQYRAFRFNSQQPSP